MSPRFRKIVAVSQIIGGTLTMGLALYYLWNPMYFIQGWYFALLESMGVVGIVAGRWLWKDDPRGLKLSRGCQGLQLV